MGASEMNKDENELLARLQAQFGDMDVGGMLQGSADGNQCSSDEVHSESSLEEPTAKELLAWQESQYEKGKMKLEVKKNMGSGNGGNAHMSALQRRRTNKTACQRTLIREYEKSEGHEWEKLAPTPHLSGATSIFFPTVLEGNDGDAGDLDLAGGVNPLLQKLVEGDPEVLGTKWTRLYSSEDGDGLSFRNLYEKIRGYDGPTVLMVGGKPSGSRCLGKINQDDRVSLGFFTTDSWIESPDHFGSNDDCFLFSLEDNQEANDVHFFRPKARSKSSSNLGTKRYMYCHPSSLAKSNRRRKDAPIKTNGSVHGIGVGGTASQPRLHLTESLEECRALAYDHLFDDGDLLSGKCTQSLFYFDVDCIEMWGVGGEEWISDALKAQKKEKERNDTNLDKARKCDKSQFLNDFENGLLSGDRKSVV